MIVFIVFRVGLRFGLKVCLNRKFDLGKVEIVHLSNKHKGCEIILGD